MVNYYYFGVFTLKEFLCVGKMTQNIATEFIEIFIIIIIIIIKRHIFICTYKEYRAATTA